MRYRIVVVLTALLALLAFAQSASADDYCAGSSAHCSLANTSSKDAAGITAAINAAHTHVGDDHVWIAAGSYDITTTTFPTFAGAPGDELDISGAGVGQTILNGPAGSQGTINLILPTASSSLSDVTLNATLTNVSQLGISMARGSLTGFELNLLNPDHYFTAVALQLTQPNLTVSEGKIATALGVDTSVIGINSTGATTTATITDVQVVGPSVSSTVNPGIQVVDGSLTVSRTKISGFARGVNAGNGTLTMTDSIVDLGTRYGAIGFRIKDSMDAISRNVDATLRRNTVVGTGDTQLGIFTGRLEAGDQTTLKVLNSAIYLTGASILPLVCDGVVNSLTIGNNAFRGTPSIIGGCTVANSPTTYPLSVSPFVNVDEGDLRPSSTSMLTDNGSSDDPSTSADLDFGHRSRLVNGDNAGSTRVDLGAYEYQRSAPTVNLTTPKTTLAPLEPTTFTADAQDIDGDALTYAWTIDGVSSPEMDDSLTDGFSSVGSHSVDVTVTDSTGLSSSASASVTVAVATTEPKPTCPAVLYAAMKVTKPKSAFKRKGKGFKVASSKQKQPYFAIKSSGGKVRFTLRAVGKNKKSKALTGSQTVKLKKGTTRLTFGGKWDKKKLKAGAYKVSVAPTSDGRCPVPTLATVTIKLK